MARNFGSRTSRRVPQAGHLHMSSSSRRSFGVPNALGIHDGNISDGDERWLSQRASWTRPNILSRLISQDDELGVKSPPSERPPIPSALHAREPDSTPLPVMSMIVLSIVSAPLHSPFLPLLSVVRPCSGSSFPQTYRCRSCSSWLRV